MNRPFVRIHNMQTNEIIDREMNDEEFAEYLQDRAAFQAKEQIRKEFETKREAALAKLEALGLTTDDLTALGL